mmetsp:Transcript_7313/g.14980  ORF Transcript_7313/g.14980 Transcript_7313/m.14980 type:complete len:100 (-) Transcript_7313:127-426(-)
MNTSDEIAIVSRDRNLGVYKFANLWRIWLKENVTAKLKSFRIQQWTQLLVEQHRWISCTLMLPRRSEMSGTNPESMWRLEWCPRGFLRYNTLRIHPGPE